MSKRSCEGSSKRASSVTLGPLFIGNEILYIKSRANVIIRWNVFGKSMSNQNLFVSQRTEKLWITRVLVLVGTIYSSKLLEWHFWDWFSKIWRERLGDVILIPWQEIKTWHFIRKIMTHGWGGLDNIMVAIQFWLESPWGFFVQFVLRQFNCKK